MLKEHRSCDVDKRGEPLFWEEDPEELLELLQLRARLGQERVAEFLEALDTWEHQSAAEILKSLRAPGRLPSNAADKFSRLLAGTHDAWKAKYGDAGLNSNETLATWLKLLGLSTKAIAYIFEKNEVYVRKQITRALEKAKKRAKEKAN